VTHHIVILLIHPILVCKLRDPWRYLKYTFRARDVDEEVAAEIYRRRGIRYGVIHELVNWLPGHSSLLDFMHLFFLGRFFSLCFVLH
jgi:hypothetical protein